jgi:hypothetical protein
MAELVLPMKKRAPISISPNVTIIFSKPKVGKSTITSKLPQALHLDFEKGTLALEVMSMQVTKLADIYEIAKLVKEAKYPYKFLVADTLSSLEDLCLPEAELRYSRSPEGKDWFLADVDDDTILHEMSGKNVYQNILNLPFGKGYRYIQDVFSEILGIFEKMAPKVVLLAHSTATVKMINKVEVPSIDLMMLGKTKFVAEFKADAIGYLYRDGKKCFIDFSASKDGGGRFRYLEKAPILISEYMDDAEGNEKLITYWDKIYAPKNNESKETKTVTPKTK